MPITRQCACDQCTETVEYEPESRNRPRYCSMACRNRDMDLHGEWCSHA